MHSDLSALTEVQHQMCRQTWAEGAVVMIFFFFFFLGQQQMFQGHKDDESKLILTLLLLGYEKTVCKMIILLNIQNIYHKINSEPVMDIGNILISFLANVGLHYQKCSVSVHWCLTWCLKTLMAALKANVKLTAVSKNKVLFKQFDLKSSRFQSVNHSFMISHFLLRLSFNCEKNVHVNCSESTVISSQKYPVNLPLCTITAITYQLQSAPVQSSVIINILSFSFLFI